MRRRLGLRAVVLVAVAGCGGSHLIGVMQGNRAAMDDFVSVMAATLPAPEFFGPENTGRIMQRAAA
jgi:hypothetical protein